MFSGIIITGALLVGICSGGNAQEVIRLWEGKAPGSEEWIHQEAVTSSDSGITMIRDVVDPSITAYLPDPSTSNGIAVLVCPGGVLLGCEKCGLIPFKSTASGRATLKGYADPVIILVKSIIPFQVSRLPLKTIMVNGKRETKK